MCTQYLHYIHPPTPFPHLLSPPTGTNPLSYLCFWSGPTSLTVVYAMAFGGAF
jgi:hypothetical protein